MLLKVTVAFTELQTVKRGVRIMTFNRYWKSLAQVTHVYHIEQQQKNQCVMLTQISG